jgi:hypothetical protein
VEESKREVEDILLNDGRDRGVSTGQWPYAMREEKQA